MMVYSPYRKDSTNYSKAIFRLYYQIVYRRDSQSKFDVRHLGGKSIAYMSSRPIKDTLTRVGAQLCVIQDLSRAVRDLSEGRYDAIICFRYQAKYFIEKYQLKNLATEDLTLAPREYCYVSHDRELIALINSELEKMEAEGRIDAIYGEVYSSFGGIRIPTWIWYLLISLVFVGNITAALICVGHLSIKAVSSLDVSVVVACQRGTQPVEDGDDTDDGHTQHHHLVTLLLLFFRHLPLRLPSFLWRCSRFLTALFLRG